MASALPANAAMIPQTELVSSRGSIVQEFMSFSEFSGRISNEQYCLCSGLAEPYPRAGLVD
jgi:hypothetical protein